MPDADAPRESCLSLELAKWGHESCYNKAKASLDRNTLAYVFSRA